MQASAFLASKELKYYTPKELAELDPSKVPEHIAIILDGNRRWAKKSSQMAAEGHRSGADNLIDILKAAQELGVRVMTLYVFSTENWHRPREEVLALMWLFETYIRKQIPEMVQQRIRFGTIGDIAKFPDSVLSAIQDAKAATKECEGMEVLFAMNYGARDEIVRAFKKMAKDVLEQKLIPEEVTEKLISKSLDTSGYPDPHLLIRTGGESRISNFLLWQLSYAEIYVTKTFWPDFTPAHLLEALLDYQYRERRLGT